MYSLLKLRKLLINKTDYAGWDEKKCSQHLKGRLRSL